MPERLKPADPRLADLSPIDQVILTNKAKKLRQWHGDQVFNQVVHSEEVDYSGIANPSGEPINLTTLDNRIWSLRRSRHPLLRTSLAALTTVVGLAFATDRLMPDNSQFHRDPSILPGDGNGAFLGHLIPGLPDENKYKITIDTKTFSTDVTAQAQTDTKNLGATQNPLAPDFELTGAEYEIDRAAAKKLLSDITQGTQGVEGSVNVGISATASDESNRSGDPLHGLGQSNPENAELALKRLQMGAQALQDEATAENIPVVISAQNAAEAQLTPDQVAQVTVEAQRLGISVNQLVNDFNDNALTDQEAITTLQTLLSANRSVKYDAKATVTKTQQVQTTTPGKSLPIDIPGIPGEGYLAMPGIIFLYYGLYRFTSETSAIRSAQKALRRRIRRGK